jgi:GNAT superfamily N-acetyltransferase
VFDRGSTRRANPLRAVLGGQHRDGVPELVIRPVDPYDGAEMDAFQDVYAAAETAEDPGVGLYSRAEAIALLTGESTELFDGLGGFVGGEMVGEVVLMGNARANLGLGRVLLWVAPQHQRHGYGSALLAHIEGHALARGRTTLRAQARAGQRHAGNRAFAERHGYTLVMTEVERHLDLPIDLARVERLAVEAAPYHDAYEIRSFVGPVPGELRASYVELRNLLMTEMPHGDLELEVGRDTVEDLDDLEREHAGYGRADVTAVAVQDGRIVAYAHASAQGGDARHVDQFGTLVHPEHRGHRLGMAVKCAELRLLAEHFPDRSFVATSNAEVNAHMVAINVALGFEIHQVWGEFEKRIGPGATSDHG